jgi:hypothetical protein
VSNVLLEEFHGCFQLFASRWGELVGVPEMELWDVGDSAIRFSRASMEECSPADIFYKSVVGFLQTVGWPYFLDAEFQADADDLDRSSRRGVA